MLRKDAPALHGLCSISVHNAMALAMDIMSLTQHQSNLPYSDAMLNMECHGFVINPLIIPWVDNSADMRSASVQSITFFSLLRKIPISRGV